MSTPFHTELRTGGANLPSRGFIVSDVRVPCRCCGGDTDVVWQPALLPGLAGYWLITCKAADIVCPLGGTTRSDTNYATFDLAPYGAQERPGWVMPALGTPEVSHV